MNKTVKGKVYNTEDMKVVAKNTVGEYGDPTGYEEVLFAAADGALFLYTNGGAESACKGKENLVAMTKAKADAFEKAHK